MPGNAKIIYGDEVLIDITQDTVDAASLLKGKTAHGANGDPVTGTCTYDADTSDATAAAAEILKDKTAYKAGAKLVGTMPNRGAVTGTISEKAGQYTVPQGYHDGSGKVGIDATEQAKIIPANIKQGVTILGETGTYGGEATPLQTKTVDPSPSQNVQVLPDDGYALSQVTVNKIKRVDTQAPSGGMIVSIACS